MTINLRRKFTHEPAPAECIYSEEEGAAYLPMSISDVDVFNEIISDEIDSAFATSIACCDRCYEQFKRYWPDVFFRQDDALFQAMSFGYIVESSRLGMYSPDEISALVKLFQCPRCLSHGPSEVWLYEHNTDIADQLEENIDSLQALGQQTPFLLLEHPFALEVLSAIRQARPATPTVSMTESWFRARSAESIEKADHSPDLLTTFGPPPSNLVAEGRFNHAGCPMLYLASDASTAATETVGSGEDCFVAELRFLRQLCILDLSDEEKDTTESELFRVLARSSLLSSPLTPNGWTKEQYVFSRFVSDCAKSAGFDAILYGSIKSPTGRNLVILSPPSEFDAMFSLLQSQKMVGPSFRQRL